ncbi:MAG TPA: homogentisate 1,2-dioxygenase [Bacteriovoracaceae bacterium]|nr:homogentisate 1,2-dioxygenase [Bacteriovoracaceae bacterium]
MAENFTASGVYTKQAHVKIPEGTYEEEHGRKGFFGRVSHLYHENQPTSWTHIVGDLKPRNLPPLFGDKALSNKFVKILYNNDIEIYLGSRTTAFDSFYRNADHDELFFIHEGEGRIETTYGHLPFAKGDYIIIPRGTTYKTYFTKPCKFLKVESASEFEEPSRGLLGPNALYDQTAKFIPEAQVGSEHELEAYHIDIKHKGKLTRVTYPYNPLDAVGWKGSLYPWKLSIYDFCPITSHRYHIPPSGHTTFVCRDFVICSFVARPLEHTSEGVLKVPFYHSNIDYDEMLFYHQGNFFSRDNIDAGAITFHPQGINHGPHPKAFLKANENEFTDEFAVMVDARNSLEMTPEFERLENKEYWKSWMKH